MDKNEGQIAVVAPRIKQTMGVNSKTPDIPTNNKRRDAMSSSVITPAALKHPLNTLINVAKPSSVKWPIRAERNE